MDALKTSRKIFRTKLDKSCVEFDAITGQQRIVESDMVGLMDILLEDKEKLDKIEEQMLELMVDAKVPDDVLLKEAEAASAYSRKVTTRRATMNKLLESFKAKRKGSAEPKRFKYEKIEFKKYGGELSEWISWWAQFEQVHTDAELTDVEKFHYLSQCMVPDSPAQKIVESYPQSAANYPKVIDELKRRCGRPELLSIHYVREFIQLAVTRINAKEKDRLCISTLYDEIVAKDAAVKSLNISDKKYVQILKTALIESCLPDETLKAWQRVVKDAQKDMYEQLIEFLRSEVDGEQQLKMAHQRFGVVDSVPRSSSSKKKTALEDGSGSLPTAAGLAAHSSEESSCVFCSKRHDSKDCGKARMMTLEERKKILANARHCYTCLRGRHIAKNCKAKVNCVVCRGRHYPILCPDVRSSRSEKNETGDREKKNRDKGKEESISSDALMQSSFTTSGVPLQTLSVRLRGSCNRIVRILLDSGAQRSCILERTAKAMGYTPVGKERLSHTLFGGSKTPERIHNRYHIELESGDGYYRCHFDCLDQPEICGGVSSVRLDGCEDELRKKKIKLMECDAGTGDIEVLIGNDIYGKLLTGRVEQLSNGLTALETKLGWVLSGKVKSGVVSHSNLAMGVTMSLFNEATLTDLWNLETIGIMDSAEQKSAREMEEEAKRHFLKTVTRDQDGRYVVQLPWTVSMDVLPNNKAIALKRLSSASKKLRAQGLWDAYNQIFEEWLQSGVIEEVGTADSADKWTKNRRMDGESTFERNRFFAENSVARRHYLPHRAVVKMESATTKVRPVFDASCKAPGSLSLNDCLEKGPNLLELLPAILLRFREKKIGVVSDIRKAFLQIGVMEEHRDFLRFLWWSDASESAVREFRHSRVVFGVNCSPFLLGAVIEHHLSDVNVGDEDLRKKLFRSMYVDNCVTSVDGEMDLQRFMAGAVRAFARAQMELVQWEWTEVHYNAFNRSAALAPELSSVLGLGWDRRKDILRVKLMPEADVEVVTKRVILSHLQRLFDPMGFLAPVVVKPKMMLQEAWVLKLGWDVPVPRDMEKKFRSWLATLDAVAAVEVPRRFTNCRRDQGSWELHIFCDASESAYAAVAFLRSESVDGTVVQMLLAKSRVSPIKRITIPRLELLACLIGARLKKFVCESLELDVRTVMWSDSTTAIAWVKRVDNWGVFVNNRVQEIRLLTEPEDWRHVPGEKNPADLPSRGCDANELAARRWWEGPAWLKMSEEHWPTMNVDPDEDLVAMERKKTVLVSAAATTEELFPRRFSSFQKMIRVVAMMMRFGTSVGRQRSGILSFEELDVAEKKIFRLVQDEHKELVGKMTNLKLQDRDDGLKVVATKVIDSGERSEFCYPVWLPSESWIVQIMMREIHEKNSHAGAQTCMRILRERFWVPRSRQGFRKLIGNCATCRRFTSKGIQEQDVALPKERIMAVSVFQVIGVDLAGPLFLKDGSKCWIVLFTCAVYRAVHLEVVTSISTEAFLRAFRRFISRRGRPSTVFSDQGTNFVGVVNILKDVDWAAVKERYGSERIDWKLNPPASPWWGGFWERLVRVVKGLLVRVLGRQSVDLDELVTVLCEVEAIVNARPLTYVSEDGDDLLALTPEMFIKGVRSGGLPELKEVTGKDLLRRHKYQVKLMEDFQSRFRNEYLSTLVQRAKEQGRGEIKIGSIVFIGNEEKKRLLWPMGRVVEVYPGGDGKIRVAKLKTENGTLIRPVQKLYPLVTEMSDEELVTMETEQEVQCPDSKPEVKTRSGRVVKIPARFVP